ncbi:MAG: hypothetical protein ACSHWY_14360 [Octadecabacter sp.]
MNEDKKSRQLGKLGVQLTLIYLISLFGGIPVMAYLGVINLAPVSLNELGDFLAGAFGPLAIFWVVLGFFQQGDELRNSVATLELQAKELANSVEQQREMVAVSRQAMDLDQSKIAREREERRLEIIPKFILSSETESGNAGFVKHLKLTNVGGTARSLTVEIKSLGSFNRPHLGNGDSWYLHVQSAMAMSQFGSQAVIYCFDQDGNQHNATLGMPLL